MVELNAKAPQRMDTHRMIGAGRTRRAAPAADRLLLIKAANLPAFQIDTHVDYLRCRLYGSGLIPSTTWPESDIYKNYLLINDKRLVIIVGSCLERVEPAPWQV